MERKKTAISPSFMITSSRETGSEKKPELSKSWICSNVCLNSTANG